MTSHSLRAYVLFGGILFGLFGLETKGHAQYYIDVWGDCDIWDSGDSIVGGCEGYDNSWGCTHWDYLNAGTLWSPSRNTSFDGGGWSGGSSLVLDSEFGNWGLDVEFDVRCSCINDQFFGFPVNFVQNVQPWPIPTGEFTDPCGDTWVDAGGAAWCMALTGGDFDGRKVQEFPSGSGQDTCNERVPNSIFPPFVTITGGPPGGWDVGGAANGWAPDVVGWASGPIYYYRSYGVTPCGFVFNQSMRINQRGGGWVEYVVNTLAGTMGPSTVASWRAGEHVERAWPN